MYESFYHFRMKPFSIQPDPEFLFLSSRHKTGLTLLEYGLLNRAMITVMIGEPGTGKTTLLNKVLDQYRDRFTVGVISTTHPNTSSILPWVADAFGLNCPVQDTVGYFRTITAFLRRSFDTDRQVLLVVDEAQNLNMQMLEDLRLLSNINDGRQNGLHIVVAGQPGLLALLTRNDMRQFAQRVGLDFWLNPLDENEVTAYVHHRLIVAGGRSDLLTDYACSLIHQLSGGNPRLINQLCDLAVACGFGERAEQITAALVLQVASDRAAGGILPSVVDPKTLLLDPKRLADESPKEKSTPVSARDERKPSPPAGGSMPTHDGAGYYRRGLGLKQVGQYREALKKFEVAGQDPMYFFKASAQRGLCLRAIGRLDEAEASFRSALALNGAKVTDVLNVRYVLALTLDKMGQSEAAQEQYREIHQADPTFRDITNRIQSVDDTPCLPVSFLKSLGLKWQQFRASSQDGLPS